MWEVVVVKNGRPGLPREVRARFWEGIRAGLGSPQAAVAAGVSAPAAWRLMQLAGGVKANAPRPGSGRYLSVAEREEIALGRARGESFRAIARRLGRPASTVSREVARNGGRGAYRALAAQAQAEARAARPKTAKLAANVELRGLVQDGLARNWSPEQVSAWLRARFPGRAEMQVSHETIYQAIYVQGRGALRRELAARLRTGRALRKPRRTDGGTLRGKIPGMVMISERPAEARDRAVPGHWEGDLILGAGGKSAIGTLVERATRFVLLLHLPDGHGADQVAAAMTEVMGTLPAQLRRSLTWDQGKEMAGHAQITLATDLDIYFCDPHSPPLSGQSREGRLGET